MGRTQDEDVRYSAFVSFMDRSQPDADGLVAHQTLPFDAFVHDLTRKGGMLESGLCFDHESQLRDGTRCHVFMRLRNVRLGLPVPPHENFGIVQPRQHVDLTYSLEMLTPETARATGQTYKRPVFAEVCMCMKIDGKEEHKVFNEPFSSPLFYLPIMLGSRAHRELPVSEHEEERQAERRQAMRAADWAAAVRDIQQQEAGFFIVNGKDRVLVSQEKRATNMVMVHAVPATLNTKRGEASHVAELIGAGGMLRMHFVPKTGAVSVELRRRKRGGTSSTISTHVPVGLLLMALGVVWDRNSLSKAVLHPGWEGGSGSGSGSGGCAAKLHELLLPSMDVADDVLQVAASTAAPVTAPVAPTAACDLAAAVLLRDAAAAAAAAAAGATTHASDGEDGGEDDGGEDGGDRDRRDDVARLLLPHLDKAEEKGFAVLYMLRRLLLVVSGEVPPDDRDHQACKRVDTAAALLSNVVRGVMARRTRDMRKIVSDGLKEWQKNKSYPPATLHDICTNLMSQMGAHEIESELQNALSGMAKMGGSDGVSQVLERFNRTATLSHLRHVKCASVGSDSHSASVRQVRMINRGTYGRKDMVETPDGSEVGLLTNLALWAHVSQASDKEQRASLSAMLAENGVVPLTLPLIRHTGAGVGGCAGAALVLLNGVIVGVHPEVAVLARMLRKQRCKNGCVPWDACIAHVAALGELRIWTDSGRLCRPLLLDHKKLKAGMAFDALLQRGIIALVDAEEESTLRIAPLLAHQDAPRWDDGYDAQEVLNDAVLGVCSAAIPCAGRNQAPRNQTGSSMAKQAVGPAPVGGPEGSAACAAGGDCHVLRYPQRALVQTPLARIMDLPSELCGQTVIVAIVPMVDNQEDSLVMNQASKHRGLFSSTKYTTHSLEEECSISWRKDQSPLICGAELRGDAPVLDLVQPGKRPRIVRLDRYSGGSRMHAASVAAGAPGKVHWQAVTRKTCVPEVGDKFASRHGQKGVVGRMVMQEDMPFTSSGITPDFVINPHAFPTRMTGGHLAEGVAAKAAAIAGVAGGVMDALPFGCEGNDDKEMDEWQRMLEGAGYQRYGEEDLYDGTTGQLLPARIMICPMQYMRLRHMVAGKMHVRGASAAKCPAARDANTRQPVKGRNRNGGFKVGEMESWCLVGHGCGEVMFDRFMSASDASRVHIVASTGRLAPQGCMSNPGRNAPPANDIVQVEVPHTVKLLMQELLSMGVDMRWNVQRKPIVPIGGSGCSGGKR